ncbi:hypothetical protein MERGE_000351 [Pneumocystis wakefieldiae]|uniref:Mitochondrial import inner membrane translocase subunit tim17 n=1 Tax=Pneumocystis wakefieldiae TaxID=38082 RepID=A0A899FV36_9ASCO|nr:hypothetical protein MERGE_000351 [Pneumocystis wakefieldiae]
MSYYDHSRDPCPYVILSDFGGAFAMGAIGGGLWHSVKGFRNSPSGEKLIGAISAVKARAPVLGGNFGVWGGVFSSFDCAVKRFLTGGSLALRGDIRSIRNSAIGCACLLAIFEGIGIAFNRIMAEQNRPIQPQIPETIHTT